MLGIETKSLLVGEGANDADYDRDRRARSASGPEVETLIHIKTLYLGPDELLVAAKLGFAGDKPLADVADAIDTVEAAIRSGAGRTVDLHRARRVPPADPRQPAHRRDRHPFGRLTSVGGVTR